LAELSLAGKPGHDVIVGTSTRGDQVKIFGDWVLPPPHFGHESVTMRGAAA